MKKSRLLKCFAALVMGALCFAVQAQNFHYQATLDSVLHPGFYRISLPPAVIADCRPGLEDMRVKDKANAEIPYVIKQETNDSIHNQVIGLPVVKTKNARTVILENTVLGSINQLLLSIKNTTADSTVTLSGSDDTTNWFVIKEDINLAGTAAAEDKTFYTRLISFPYSNYRFFRISMQGSEALPFNIFKAVTYNVTGSSNPAYELLPQPRLRQLDSSDKKSYIWLQFDKSYRIDQLRFTLGGSRFFNRSFTLYDNGNKYYEMVATGNVVSKDSTTTVYCRVKTNRLLLVINNEDNAPLQLNAFKAFQLSTFLVAYLDPGKQYSLFYGDSLLTAPAYDLRYFDDSIGQTFSSLRVLTTQSLHVAIAKKEDTVVIDQWLLWCIIIAVLLLLIYFSYKLVKDINLKNNSDVPL